MIIKQDSFFSPANANRMLHIYLPDSYPNTEERYPVMYFFDGHNLYLDSDATYGKSWGLSEFLDHWCKPIICVGIECGHGERERLQEYIPYRLENDYLGLVDGIGAQTLHWMVHELKPYIDRSFRTYSFREATGIAGSSLGGLMSLYGIIHHNAVFSKAACLSTMLSPCLHELENDIQTYPMDGDTRVYLSWGSREEGAKTYSYHEKPVSQTGFGNHSIQDALTAKGCLTRLYYQQGGRHREADWEKQVPLFLDYLWL